MKVIRNKAKEEELIKKRNKAYKEADKYEAQLRKEMGVSVNEDLRTIEQDNFFNNGIHDSPNLDNGTTVKKIVKMVNEARGFINEETPIKKEKPVSKVNKLTALINEARGL